MSYCKRALIYNAIALALIFVWVIIAKSSIDNIGIRANLTIIIEFIILLTANALALVRQEYI